MIQVDINYYLLMLTIANHSTQSLMSRSICFAVMAINSLSNKNFGDFYFPCELVDENVYASRYGITVPYKINIEWRV